MIGKKHIFSLAIGLIWLVLFTPDRSFAQEHPLSKHDSALVVKYTALYDDNLNQHKNMKDASHYLNEIAFIYWEHNQYQAAIDFYKLSLEVNESIENENGIAMLNNNLGMLHADIADYEQSYEYFIQTLGARRSKGEKLGMISALINLSVVLNNLKRYDESIGYLKEALNLSRGMNDVAQMKSCYGMLSETYEKAGNAKQSIYYFDFYKTFTKMAQDEQIDKIMVDFTEEKFLKQKLEVENKKNLEQLAVKKNELKKIQIQSSQFDEKLNQYDSLNKSLYENLNQKELQLEVLTKESQIQQLKAQQEIQEQRVEKEREYRIRQVAIVIAIGLIIFIAFIIRSNRRTKKYAKHLKEKNEKIEHQKEKLADLNNNLQQKVNERTKTLRLANEKLSEYIWSNSHIIRRPVANIKGLLNLLMHQDFEEKYSDYLKPLQQSVDELDEVINDSNENLTLNKNMINDFHHATQD